MIVKCKDCKHWEPTKENRGICFRYAPRPEVLATDRTTFITVWPETEGDRRCGEGESE